MCGDEDVFEKAVRARDRKCVVSGAVNSIASIDCWFGVEAAHVFPLEEESLWAQCDYGRWVTNMESSSSVISRNKLCSKRPASWSASA